MNVQPVILRELREASRRRETWRLRLLFSGGAGLAFAFGMILPDVSAAQRGQVVLLCQTVSAFVLSLFTGVYLTADSISSEKREGTLGLLFLTPLNGRQIVLGKMATHALQVAYAWFGGFPFFYLTLLLGGVVWTEVTRILLVLLVTLFLSLACGLFWSTVVTEARTAVLATAVSLLLVTLLPWAWPTLKASVLGSSIEFLGQPLMSPMMPLSFAFELNHRRMGPFRTSEGAFIYWVSLSSSLGIGLTMVAIASRLLPRVWRHGEERGASHSSGPRKEISGEEGSLPSWRSLARCTGDPMHWLASRGLKEASWMKWLKALAFVFFLFMLVVSVSTKFWEEGFITAFCTAYVLHLVTRVQWALTATRRLQEDRRSGAMETVLVTPVQEPQIISAHHGSLRRAFRSSLTVLLIMNALLQLAVLLFPRQLRMDSGAWGIFTVFMIGGALITLADAVTLRWLALREALHSSTPLKAAGCAIGWLVGGAWMAFAGAWVMAVQCRQVKNAALVFCGWVGFCLLYDWWLARRCRRWLRHGLRRRLAEG